MFHKQGIEEHLLAQQWLQHFLLHITLA